MCIYIYIICVFVCVFAYILIFFCLYINSYTHTHTRTHTHTHTRDTHTCCTHATMPAETAARAHSHMLTHTYPDVCGRMQTLRRACMHTRWHNIHTLMDADVCNDACRRCGARACTHADTHIHTSKAFIERYPPMCELTAHTVWANGSHIGGCVLSQP